MDENTFEIRDGEIDVEKIMERIRETIRRRKEAGLYPPEPVSAAFPQSQAGGEKESEVARDIVYLSDNWNIQNTGYFISSHRPFTGKFLVKGRELVHGEVRRYVEPVFWRQSEFNGSAVRVFNDVNVRLAGLESRLNPDGAFIKTVRDGVTGQVLDVLNQVRAEVRGEVGGQIQQTEVELRDEISSVQRQTGTEVRKIVAGMKSDIKAVMQECLRREDEEIRSEISSVNDAVARMKIEMESLIEEKVRERLAEMDADIRDRAGLARVLEQRISISNASREGAGISGASESPDGAGLNYFVFEERFRGSRQEIKERQASFIPYFEGRKNVLDIGCGRGEFLELAQEHGVGARGVDIDDTMVHFCRSKGLDVEKVDAISYLENLEDRSLDGIFIDQVVEHLEPAYLVRLLELCCMKLQYGYYLVAETVNPLSFVSLANFYIDMSHVRPVHPETMTFLFGVAGFREIETQFSSPVPEEWRLHIFPNLDGANDENKAFFESYNHTIDRLNGILYGAQDYAVIGKK
ncbi:MAG: methionine biosynthesis protein MetW [Methanofollis sp.]|uniref:methionine biosynthesis protein MetW n=1 Tax=Methanofollis sp. TaxID=2052835 RepID=UPI002601EDB1|nr:methionine biosynthesis protein MetW [Methanofollis sp.]MDD4254487.1 methionine biosynthesis protein MetW [Methanofollis sp.]